jgi:hypothetical protein
MVFCGLRDTVMYLNEPKGKGAVSVTCFFLLLKFCIIFLTNLLTWTGSLFIKFIFITYLHKTHSLPINARHNNLYKNSLIVRTIVA